MMGQIKVEDFVFECPICGSHDYFPPVIIKCNAAGQYEYLSGALNGKHVNNFHCCGCSVNFSDLIKFGGLRERLAHAREVQERGELTDGQVETKSYGQFVTH